MADNEAEEVHGSEPGSQDTGEDFRLLVEAIQDYAIFMLDAEGLVTTWNRGAERIKGWPAGEVIGRHFRVFYLPEDVAAGHPERELELAAAEGRYEEDGWRVRRDGSRFFANVVITALRDDEGRLRGFAKITRDLTERRQAEERLRQANEALRQSDAFKSQFLAMTAHELATPITVITGFLQGWEHLDEADQRAAREAMTRQAHQLGRLVDDLKTASQLDAGSIDVRAEVVSVADVMQQALVAVGSTAAPITLACSPGLRARADADRLCQVVSNYLTNALRYGEAPITLSARGDGVVEIRVCDAGPGISSGFAERLFEKFARDPATADRARGSGLGLFIVRGLAQAMGGDAWYEPNSPRGACFGVRVPAA